MYKFEVEISSTYEEFTPIYDNQQINTELDSTFLAFRNKLPSQLVFKSTDYDSLKTEIDNGVDRLNCRLSEWNGTDYEVLANGYLAINQDGAEWDIYQKKVTLEVITTDEYIELEEIIDNEIDLYGFTDYLTFNLQYDVNAELEFAFSDDLDGSDGWELLLSASDPDLVARIVFYGRVVNTDFIYNEDDNKTYCNWSTYYPTLSTNSEVVFIENPAPNEYILVHT